MKILLLPRNPSAPPSFKHALGTHNVLCLVLGRGNTKIDTSCPPKPYSLTQKTNNQNTRILSDKRYSRGKQRKYETNRRKGSLGKAS